MTRSLEPVRVEIGGIVRRGVRIAAGRKLDSVLINEPGRKVRVYKVPHGATDLAPSFTAQALLWFIRRNAKKKGATKPALEALKEGS